MAQPLRSFDPADLSAPADTLTLPPASAVVAVGEAPIEWSASPARALHEQLMRSFAQEPVRRQDRLPVHLRLAIIGAAVLTPWVAIAAGWALLA